MDRMGEKTNSGEDMTLKSSRVRAFLKMFLLVFVVFAFFTVLLPKLEGKMADVKGMLQTALLGGAFAGVFVSIVFTPGEISWNDENFMIRTLFRGSCEFRWEQLEAYNTRSGGYGTFLIKFEGRQAFQIVPAGFRQDEWQTFQTMLRERFPEKKTSVWFGTRPMS